MLYRTACRDRAHKERAAYSTETGTELELPTLSDVYSLRAPGER